MEFSFNKAYRFRCFKCAKCCYQEALSLTQSDYNRLKRFLDSKGARVRKDSSHFHEIESLGACPFLKGDICSIYSRRPVVCRAFPLTFSFLPDGQLYVNLIRCKGIGLNDGKSVDESFVTEVVRDIEELDPEFFPTLRDNSIREHESLLPFLDGGSVTDFESKTVFLSEISKWLSNKSLRGQNIRIKCHVLLSNLLALLERQVGRIRERVPVMPPLILTKDDVENIVADIDRDVPSVLERGLRSTLEAVQDRNARALSTNRTEVFWDGELKKVGLEDDLPFKDLYGKTTYVKVKELIFEKGLEPEAERMALEYIEELLNRVDVGGFPVSGPLAVVLPSLDEYSVNLHTYSQFYSRDQVRVSSDSMEKAIQDLDTRLLINKIYRENSSRQLSVS